MYTQASAIFEGKINKLSYFPVRGNAPCAGPVTSVTAPVHQRQGNPQPQPKQLQRVRLPSWKRFRRGRTLLREDRHSPWSLLTSQTSSFMNHKSKIGHKHLSHIFIANESFTWSGSWHNARLVVH